jgi:hypothetical protein
MILVSNRIWIPSAELNSTLFSWLLLTLEWGVNRIDENYDSDTNRIILYPLELDLNLLWWINDIFLVCWSDFNNLIEHPIILLLVNVESIPWNKKGKQEKVFSFLAFLFEFFFMILWTGYLACARCSASGVCLSIDPISLSSASDRPLQVPATQRCPNCSGAGKVKNSVESRSYF